MTIPLLPFINKLTDHLVSIRCDRWTSRNDPGPKLMAGRERVIENDGWHWGESPEGPLGAITGLIPLQINAGTNPKPDTSRQDLIRLPFLLPKYCLFPWHSASCALSRHPHKDGNRWQKKAKHFQESQSGPLSKSIQWQYHQEALPCTTGWFTYA